MASADGLMARGDRQDDARSGRRGAAFGERVEAEVKPVARPLTRLGGGPVHLPVQPQRIVAGAKRLRAGFAESVPQPAQLALKGRF